MGGLRKQEKKCVYNPAVLEAALPETRGAITQQAATRMYCVQSFNLTGSIKLQIFTVFCGTSVSTQ